MALYEAMRAGIRPNALRVVIALAVIALLGEASFRTFGAFIPGNYRTSGLIERDAEFGWKHIPSMTTWFRTTEYLTRFDTDERGIRQGVRPLAPPNARRILILGDSFVEGLQVQADQTIGARVAAYLSHGTDVLSVGVSAYGTDQEVLLAERLLPEFRPEVVVLVFTVANDVWNNDWALESRRPTAPKPRFELSGDSLMFRPLAPEEAAYDPVRWIVNRSALLSVIRSGLIEPFQSSAGVELRRWQLEVLDEPNDEWVRAWKITDLLLKRFAASVRASGAMPVLFVAPEICQVHVDGCLGRTGSASSDGPQRRLLQLARDANINAVEPLADFRTHAAAGERLYVHNGFHWNVAGHDLAARELGRYLDGLLASMTVRTP